MNTETENSSAHYLISTVAELTGINPITLRAWERRYGLIQPQRTEKGHRLYSTEDVEQIREVLRLVEEGVPIGQVRSVLQAGESAPVDISGDSSWLDYRGRMVDAIENFDESGLEAVYNEVLALYPIEIVTRRLLVPLLKELGDRWENAIGSVAEEHFFGVYMRNKLGARFHHRQGNPRGPRLVAACLPGELHEIGLLLFALAAHNRGFQIVLLGADMPLQEIPLVAHRAKCDAVVLTGTIQPSNDLLTIQLPNLVSRAMVPVFVGGPTAQRFATGITAAGAHPVGDDLVLGLREIERALQDVTPTFRN
jgi:DNA-binding transcriptional MerR regulator